MISSLSGTLAQIDQGSILVEVNGVGYEVFLPSSMFEDLPRVGSQIKIYTYQYVREDQISLYGFLTREQRHLFILLLSVSGIGPKGGLALLSTFKIDELVIAITQSNVDYLATAPGIGSKTAQRIVIELKEKIAKTYGVSPSEVVKGMPGEEPLLKDAVSALITLGYTPREARQAILKAEIDLKAKPTIEEIIRKALKVLT